MEWRSGSKEIVPPPAGCTEDEWEAHIQAETVKALAEGYLYMHYARPTCTVSVRLKRPKPGKTTNPHQPALMT
jgi:hypothetical protein